MKNIEKIQKLLLDNGVDALVLHSRTNRLYATGQPINDGMVIVTPETVVYFTDSRYLETAKKSFEGLMQVHLVDATHTHLQRLSEYLAPFHVSSVGFEDEQVTVHEFNGLQKAIAAPLVPFQKQISALRAQKEPWEIEKIRRAQKITDKTFRFLLGIIRAGMTEKELAAELIASLYRQGAEGLSFQPVVVSGSNTSLPHGIPGDRILQFGDFITLDFGCVWEGYCSDMTRTVALGFASDEMHAVYQVVLEAQNIGISAVRAGKTGREIDASARGVITRAGYGNCFGHGLGHSLGLEVHETPGFSPRCEERIPVGAVMSVEPGIYLPNRFGVRIEDMVVVRKEGCENLTKSSKDFIIL